MASKKKSKSPSSTIVLNRKARHDFYIEDRLEAGVVLEGWEVKSLRAGKIQIIDGYIALKNGEAFLQGAVITPMLSASTHVDADPRRTRKLLLHHGEISRLIGAVDRKGYTIIATAMYWKRGKAKVELGLAKGKKQHDKRSSDKSRDWDREKGRIMKVRL
ncbi:MAG: SsrA-binding protein [Gammaproteobacteria bacterium]|jgi:SsrA-binding protein